MKKNLSILFVMIISAQSIIYAQSWSLTGNSGTSSTINYLGTSDAKALEFRVNNQKSGYIDYLSNKLANTGFGYQTLLNIKGGLGGNSAFGYQGLFTNTSGAYNTAIGQLSMYFNQTGSSNTATGVRSLYSNTSGGFNVAFGNRASYFNTTGSTNTAIGNNALYNNTTGYSNVAVGAGALYSNITNSNSVAVGDSALFSFNLYSSQNYSGNTAIGTKALYANVNGTGNTATGWQALKNSNSVDNSAFGESALTDNTTGYGNTAIGENALGGNTTGSQNCAIGDYAMWIVGDGSYNTVMGGDAMEADFHGSNCTAIGYETLSSSGNYATVLGAYAGDDEAGTNTTLIGAHTNCNYDTYSNSTALGYYALITGSNQVRVGNSSVTSIGGYVNWSNISDGRVKKNIKSNIPGLAFINKLNPVSYNLDLDKADQLINASNIKSKDSSEAKLKNADAADRSKKEQIVYSGFVAQDVEKAAKELNYDFSGVDAPKNDKDLYGLRYAEFVVPLVKAVQELSKTNDAKDKSIDSLKKQNQQLSARLDKIEAMLSQQSNTASTTNKTVSKQTIELNGPANLAQNIPNPFTNSTTINYFLPHNSSNAAISFYDANGTILKSVKLAANGNGSLTLQADELSSGVYRYTLTVDGKVIDSKQMILSK